MTLDVTDLSEEDVLVNMKGTSVPWRTEWDKEYRQYQRIRGKPAGFGRKDTRTIRNNFMGKTMNLIEPSIFIGSKILKISKTDRSGSSIGGNREVGTSLSSFSKGGENMSGTKFEVSFDGDFARNCEFIVSLPILEKGSRSSSGNCRFRPKRGLEESGESFEEEGRKQEGSMAPFDRFFNNQKDLDDETSSDSEGETGFPSPQRKAAEAWRAAGAWELRALRAEESLKRYKQGLAERKGEAKLKDTLSSLLNEDSGVMDERNTKSEWAARAFDTMPGDKWIVLKVPQGNRGHVLCDFCDGDDPDDKKWMEGPFSQSLTLRELIEYQIGSKRERRRECTDNLLRKAHSRKSKEKSVEDPRPDVEESSSGKAPSRSAGETRNEGREELMHKQRNELQYYNDRKAEGPLKPSRKAIRHARRNTDKEDKGEEDSIHGRKRGSPEWVQSVGDKAMPYKPANPLEGKNKRKRSETMIDPALLPARDDSNSGLARSNEPSAPLVMPTVDAWPVLESAGARKRRNKMSRRQREGLNPSCPRARARLVESTNERGQEGGVN